MNLNKKIGVLIVFLLVISFLNKDGYKSINDIDPALLEEPIQTEITNNEVVKFTRYGYEYEATPLYDYEINSLVVSKKNYTSWGLDKTEGVYPIDLCVLWGDNAKNKIYKNEDLSITQGPRNCMYGHKSSVDFNGMQLSNNHLVIKDSEIEKQAKSISVGDQVKIKGQLIELTGKSVGKHSEYDPTGMGPWKSSVSRDDTGDGACEIILVNEINILKKAHPGYFYLYKISFYALIFFLIFNIGKFVLSVAGIINPNTDN